MQLQSRPQQLLAAARLRLSDFCNYVLPVIRMLCALSQPAEKAQEPLPEVLKKAAWKAMGGGTAGAVAMFANVGALM